MKTLHVVFELNPAKFLFRPWPKKLREGYILIFAFLPLHVMYTSEPPNGFTSHRLDLSIINTQ